MVGPWVVGTLAFSSRSPVLQELIARLDGGALSNGKSSWSHPKAIHKGISMSYKFGLAGGGAVPL